MFGGIIPLELPHNGMDPNISNILQQYVWNLITYSNYSNSNISSKYS